MSHLTSLTPPQSAPNWNFTPQQVSNNTAKLIAKIKELDDKIASLPIEDANYENTFFPIFTMENHLSSISNQISTLNLVSSDKELRNTLLAAEKDIAEASVISRMRHDVFLRVRHALNSLNNSLSPEIIRGCNKVHEEYVRSGLGLDETTRKEVENLKKRGDELSIEFSDNLNKDVSFIAFSEDELEGVPKDVIEGFEKTDDEKLKMTFQYPDVLPVLQYAKNPETRKRAFLGKENRLKELNTPLLEEQLEIRAKLASLLGYSHHADYILETKMAKKSTNVFSFLEDIKQRFQERGNNDLNILLELKNLDFPNTPNILYSWDKSYYLNKLLESKYQIDQEKIAEYFPLDHVIKECLSFFETLFSLKFVEIFDDMKSTWHPDMKQYAVWKDQIEFQGWLYMDLHPRPNKYGHACNIPCSQGYTELEGPNKDKRSFPVTALICNFTKPTANKPSLIKHSELRTFLHELGHGIHDILGKTQLSRFHGTSVSRDFVECPSQMLEFWVWEPAQLKQFSHHYKNGSKLPDEIIDSLVKSKHVCSGLHYLRQLYLTLLDMHLHTKQREDKQLNLHEIWNSMSEQITLMSTNGEKTAGYASFGHIMGGYDAGYYSYLWSEVFAADIYYSIFKDKPLTSQTGLIYRTSILEKGGSRDEMEGLKEVLGREPNSQAFMQELGFAT